MKSAGETPTTTQPQSVQTAFFTPVQIPTPNRGGGSRNNTSTIIKLSGPEGAKQAEQNAQFGLYGQAIDAVVDTIGMGLQYGLAGQAMDCQYKIASKYYDTQGEIAGYQREVALKQLDVQFAAVNAQQKMHGSQVLHEETMARLEGSTQARLASIAEQGKTDRAKVLAVTDAFSRRDYNYGMTAA